MKKSREYRGFWKTYGLCAALILALLLAGCGGPSSGGGSGSRGGSADNGGGEGTETVDVTVGSTGDEAVEENIEFVDDGTGEEPAADSTAVIEGPAESVNELPAPVTVNGDGGIVYEEDGLVIDVTDITTGDVSCTLQMDITNNGNKDCYLEIFPFKVNDMLTLSGGTFELVGAGETIQASVELNVELLPFAGIDSVDHLQAFFQIMDENLEQVGDMKMLSLVGSGGDAGAGSPEGGEAEQLLTHSDNVVYDKDGVKVSFAGSYTGTDGGLRAVFLAENDTEETISVGVTDENGSVDDGSAGGRGLFWDNATLPAGEISMLRIYVIDEATYKGTSFKTADAEIVVTSEKPGSTRPIELIPVHMEAKGDSISVTSEEAYVPDNAILDEEDLMEE